MNGVLNVLKPTGMTSSDIVTFVRRNLNIKKVGHTGTLDPNVSGVLPICVGKATKFSDYLMSGDKEYIVEIKFGSITDTKDSYGKILTSSDECLVNNLEYENIKIACEYFLGESEQVPPAFSAVKYKGRKLYEYARENIIIEKPPRKIRIDEIEMLSYNETTKNTLIRVRCSKGTYMRNLCEDIGKRLNVDAHMGILIRTESKGLNISDALTLEDIIKFCKLGEIEKYLIAVDDIYSMSKICISNKYYDKLIVGNEVPYDNSQIEDEQFYVYCNDNLIGIGIKIESNKIKIKKMLI